MADRYSPASPRLNGFDGFQVQVADVLAPAPDFVAVHLKEQCVPVGVGGTVYRALHAEFECKRIARGGWYARLRDGGPQLELVEFKGDHLANPTTAMLLSSPCFLRHGRAEYHIFVHQVGEGLAVTGFYAVLKGLECGLRYLERGTVGGSISEW